MRKLRLHTFYRLSVWLPLALPAVVIIFMNLTQWRPGGTRGEILQFIGYSGIIGGVPYLALAIWAMFWIGGRPEREIRRRAIMTPILMMAICSPYVVIMGVHADFTYAMRVFLFLASMIGIMGFFYVALVFVLRRLMFGPIDVGPGGQMPSIISPR